MASQYGSLIINQMALVLSESYIANLDMSERLCNVKVNRTKKIKLLFSSVSNCGNHNSRREEN